MKKIIISVYFLFFLNLFILFAYAQESGSKNNIAKYKELLSQLNSSNKESILKAKDEFFKHFKKDDKTSEEGFQLFRDYYIELINKHQDKFAQISNVLFEEPAFYEVIEGTFKNPLAGFEKLNKLDKDRIKRKYSTQLNEIAGYLKSGIKITGDDEEGYYLTENLTFLSDMLQNYEIDFVKFIEFMKSEDKRIVIDGGLQISWEDLRKKLLRFEKFAGDYPNLKETQEIIEPKIKWLFAVYIDGLDNTPAFDWETQKLNSGLKNSYEFFLKENKKSKFFETLQKYYKILEKNKFMYNDEVQKYILDLNLWGAW